MAALVTSFADTDSYSGLKNGHRLKYTMQQMLSCRSSCAAMIASGKEIRSPKLTDACYGVTSKKRGTLLGMDLDAPEAKKKRVAYALTNSPRDCSTIITSGRENIVIGITTPEIRREVERSKWLPVIGTSKWESVKSTHTVACEPKMKRLDRQNMEKTRSVVRKDCSRKSEQCRLLSKKDIFKEGKCHQRHGSDRQNMEKTRSVVPNDCSRKSEQCHLSNKDIFKGGKCHERHGLDRQNMEKTRSVVPNDCSRKSEQCLLSKKDIFKEGKCHERHGLDRQNMEKTWSIVPNDCSRKSEHCLLSKKDIFKEGKCHERHGLDLQNMEKTRSVVPKDCLGRSHIKECVLSKKEILKEEKRHERHGCGAISVKPLSSPAQVDRQDDSERLPNDITCQRNRRSDFYFADIRGQKLGNKHGCSSSTTNNSKPVSSPRGHPCTSDSLAVDNRGQRQSKSVLHSNSNGSISSDNQMQQSSHSATGSVCDQKEGNVATVNGTQLSDTRALRCEWLKKRFGDTILRAQHKIQECNGKKVDHVKLQQEKEILEMKTRDAEAAGEAERKLQREKKREAARIALTKMESTVQFDDHVATMKDFAMLIGYTQVYESCEQHVLERFGLFFTP